ncbi:MAG TPA: shikimate kinase [Acidimicrobiales bacterium]
MARLVLVGLSGVGKTTVARAIADKWQIRYLDTDDMIAESVGRPAPQYLRDEGEGTFRARELKELIIALSSNSVVATGGGVVCTPEARDLLKTEPTYWLDCPDDEIVPRLGEVERPLLGGHPVEGIARLRNERSGWYREVSRARVDASGTIDEVVARVRANVEGVRA